MFPPTARAGAGRAHGHVASVAAVSITDLLDQADGHTVGTADGEVTLETKIATSEAEERVTVRFTELGPFDRVLHAAAPTPDLRPARAGARGPGLRGHPARVRFAGFAGLGMLALAVYGLTVVPFSPLGLGLLLAGIGLSRSTSVCAPSAALVRRDARVHRRVGAGLRRRRPGDRRLPVAHRGVLGSPRSSIGGSV